MIKRSWDVLDETKSEMFACALSAQHSIKPFLTERRHVGIEMEALDPGDLVVVFQGATVPFVLRRRQRGEGYELWETHFSMGLWILRLGGR